MFRQNLSQIGFTLVELVVVIVILGILAATALPKFILVSNEANENVFKATVGAFRAGVNQVHIKWQVNGRRTAILNFIPNADTVTNNSLSVNSNGYPADSRGTSLTTNSTNDCEDVWNSVLSAGSVSVSQNTTTDFQALYLGSFRCQYTFNADNSKTITYDSNTGHVQGT